jgi:ribonuclease T1
MLHRRPYALVLLVLLALFASMAGTLRHAHARTGIDPDVAVSALPPEARATLQRIRLRGPFPYERDGVVFNNREHILPAQPRGYYHEYTVPTPGVKTRGARRIICGGDVGSLAECYYSDDHYRTFRRIRP